MKKEKKNITIGSILIGVFLFGLVLLYGLMPRKIPDAKNVLSLKTYEVVKEAFGSPPIVVNMLNDSVIVCEIEYLDRYILPRKGIRMGVDKKGRLVEAREIKYNKLILYLFPGYQRIKILARFR